MRRQIGAVIVTDENRIVATGYNGPPSGYPYTCMSSCPRNLYADATGDYRNCISIHAEANALMFCDRRERKGGSIYVNEAPCFDCAKLIANSGLARVMIYTLEHQEHRDVETSLRTLRHSGLEVTVDVHA
jgi:dCMP deaminase